MPYLYRFCFLGLLLFLNLLVRAERAPAVQRAPAPVWLLPVKSGGHPPSAKDITQGYYLSLVDVQVHVEKKARYVHLVRDIATSAGVQHGSGITIAFNPDYEQLTVHSLTVYRDGKPRNVLRAGLFKVSPLETERDRFIYDGGYTASTELEDIRKGDRIEYAYTVTGRNPILGETYSDDLYFDVADPLPHWHQVLISKSDRSLIFRPFNNPPTYRTTRQADLTVYEWDAYDQRPVPREDYEPEWLNTAPHWQISEYKNWSAVVDWALPLYRVAPASPALMELVRTWKQKAGTDALAYLKQAVAFVQDDIRYLGMELGAYSHQPHRPDQVLRQRYGDCKDKSLLLCTLLQAGGLEAYPALTHSGNANQLNRLLPDPLAFNHVIVWTTLKGQPIWVDATLTDQRWQGGYSIPFYGQALVIRPGEKALRSIPASDLGRIRVTETYLIPSPHAPNAVGQLRVESVYTHQFAESLRSQLTSQSFADLEKSYRTFYQQLYDDQQVESMDSLRIIDPANSQTLTTRERYQIQNFWQKDSTTGQLSLSVLGKILKDQLLDLPAQTRQHPVALSFPYELVYVVRLQLPEPWNIETSSWTIRRQAYEMDFAGAYTKEANLFTLTYRYKNRKDHVTPEDLKTYRADVEKMTQELSYQLTYNTDAATGGGSFDTGALTVVLLSLLVFGWLSWRGYRYDRPAAGHPDHDQRIGGWLFLLGIGVTVSPLTTLFGLVRSPLLGEAAWEGLSSTWNDQKWLIRPVGYAELSVQAALSCFTMLAVVLFYKRRNTFPLFYRFLLVFSLVYTVGDALLLSTFVSSAQDSVFLGQDNVMREAMNAVGHTIINALIWIPYLYWSRRVRETFTKTYEETSGRRNAGRRVAGNRTDEHEQPSSVVDQEPEKPTDLL